VVKFGVWVVDLMLQYTVGFLNAAGHDRGGVVWLELTLELGLVGLVWPFCGVLCRVFLASMGLLEGFLVAKGVSEEMPVAVGMRRQATTRASTTPERKADAEVVSLCHAPIVMAKGETPSDTLRPYSPHSLPQPACGRLGPLAYGREEAESKKLNALNLCLIPGDSASI